MSTGLGLAVPVLNLPSESRMPALVVVAAVCDAGEVQITSYIKGKVVKRRCINYTRRLGACCTDRDAQV